VQEGDNRKHKRKRPSRKGVKGRKEQGRTERTERTVKKGEKKEGEGGGEREKRSGSQKGPVPREGLPAIIQGLNEQLKDLLKEKPSSLFML